MLQSGTSNQSNEDSRLLSLKKRIIWYCENDLASSDYGDQQESALLSAFERIIDRVYEATRPSQLSSTNAISNSLYSTAAPARQSTMTMFKCMKCGNQSVMNTVRDIKSGDSICLGIDRKGCGMILQDHLVDEGSEKRNFEDTEDRNHHGSVPDPLMPDHINLETRLVAPLHGNSMSMNKFKKIVADNQRIEREVMDLNHDDRRTTHYYKSYHKKEVFSQMNEIAYNLSLHDQVVSLAKIIFSRYREAKERVQHESAVVAACLVLAYADILQSNSTRNANIDKKIEYNLNEDIKTPKEIYEQEISILNQDIDKDTCLSIHKGVKIGQFDWNQLNQWLIAILTNYNTNKAVQFSSTLIESIVKEIEHALRADYDTKLKTKVKASVTLSSQESESKPTLKRRREDLSDLPVMFGTTTQAGRLKTLAKPKNDSKGLSTVNGTTSSSSTNTNELNTTASQSFTAGQIFCRYNLTLFEKHIQLLRSNPEHYRGQRGVLDLLIGLDIPSIIEYLRQCRSKRLSFETRLEKINSDYERETHRLRVMSTSSTLSRVLTSLTNQPINSNQNTQDATKIEPAEVNNDLNELLSEVVSTTSQFRSTLSSTTSQQSINSPVEIKKEEQSKQKPAIGKLKVKIA